MSTTEQAVVRMHNYSVDPENVAEFLKARRAARSFAQHYQEPAPPPEDESPASQEIASEHHSDSA